MSGYNKKPNFAETEEGIEVKQVLRAMVADPSYNTQPGYSADVTLYPNHSKPFEDVHMDYLRARPATDRQHYLSNLRLMTRIK
jgi:hypothetical protein